MELMVSVKNLRHAATMFKTAYITRSDMHSEFDDINYRQSKRGKEDLVYCKTLITEGMPNDYENPENLINAIETDPATKWKATGIARDFILTMDNALTVKKEDGFIDKEKTKALIEHDVDQFFTENFTKEGYAVVYAIHFNGHHNKHDLENLHCHAVILCNQYSSKENKFLTKTYRNDDGKWIYRNELDDIRKSKYAMQKIRKEWAKWQNKSLKKMNINDKVEYQTFKERGLDKMQSYHLSKYHYEELEQLKKQYAHIENIVERNETIIKDRTGKLTKKQIHNLRAEEYNWFTDAKEMGSADTIKNDALTKAMSNKVKGIKYTTLNIGGTLAKAGAKQLEEAAKQSNKNNRRGR
jgi:hypothetical protein